MSHKENHELYELVDKLKSQGKAILFISHKFDEIFRIADRYTVFRDGAFVGEGLVSDVTESELVRPEWWGRSVDQIFPARAHNIGAEVLTVAGYSHPTEFADIGFTLRQGEILGFYGLVGAGRSEVMQRLFGMTRPSKGAMKLDGQVRIVRSADERLPQASSMCPKTEAGRVPQGPADLQNVTLPSLPVTSRNGFLRLAEEFRLTRIIRNGWTCAPPRWTKTGAVSAATSRRS